MGNDECSSRRKADHNKRAMTASAPNTTRQRRSILGLLLAGIGAVCLPAYLVQLQNGGLNLNDELFGRRALQEEFESDAQMYRLLSQLGDDQSREEDLSIPDYLLHAGEEGHLSAEEAIETAIQQAALKGHPQPNLSPYNILDVFKTKELFDNVYGVLVYDNLSDEFLFLYPKGQQWTSGCVKLKKSFRNFAYMLRQTFPDRFCGSDCDEWAIGLTSGDYPHFKSECLVNFPHGSAELGCHPSNTPVFQFGSVFRDFEPLTNMIAMPMPLVHMLCFKVWLMNGNSNVCYDFRGVDMGGKLIFGDESTKWEDLKPQVVWRGTDFGYLNHLAKVDAVETGRAPNLEIDIPQEIRDMKDSTERKLSATRAMMDHYHQLLPRWKGVVLTAQAEREAEQAIMEQQNDSDLENMSLPWADIRFTGPSGAASMKGRKAQAYDEFAELGIQSIGGSKSGTDLSTYRYHIDLGGGGGTTWTGTHTKLAMPGLLFHHVTPTKDYIHDRMLPWVHYVPVKADLSDLKQKYEWAESHPEVAERIAKQGTELMRQIGTVEGFGEMFQEDFVEPVRRVMEAYRPVSQLHPPNGNDAPPLSWREVLKQAQDEQGLPGVILREHCTGKSGIVGESCTAYDADDTL